MGSKLDQLVPHPPEAALVGGKDIRQRCDQRDRLRLAAAQFFQQRCRAPIDAGGGLNPAARLPLNLSLLRSWLKTSSLIHNWLSRSVWIRCAIDLIWHSTRLPWAS